MSSADDRSITYEGYLALDVVLGSQRPCVPDAADELTFIVMHQAHELLFKVLVDELRRGRDHIVAGDIPPATSMNRIGVLQRALNAQIEVLFTMPPEGFAAFRPALGTASGSDSRQYRVMQGLLGMPSPRVPPEPGPGVPAALAMSLSGGHCDDLARLAPELRRIACHGRSCRSITRRVLADLLEFDVLAREWRRRHAELVEGMIGHRRGTGGSSGSAHLRTGVDRVYLPALWPLSDSLGVEVPRRLSAAPYLPVRPAAARRPAGA